MVRVRLRVVRANQMLRGTVNFRARVVDPDSGLTFPLLEFNPHEVGVDKVEIEARSDDIILSKVYVSAVADRNSGIAIATKVHLATLDRISFLHAIAIDKEKMTGSEFSTINPIQKTYDSVAITPEPVQVSVGVNASRVVHGYSAAGIKNELEQMLDSRGA